MKKFALVLGGGAAKGFAHIGVLKVLKEHGLTPDLIVGSSMGALVGGAYASGVEVEKMEEYAKSITNNKVLDFSLSKIVKSGALVKGKKIEKIAKELIGEVYHRQLKIKFIAVATELKTGKEIHLDKGLVWKNVLASSAIPAVFPAVNINEQLLCDGGLRDNVPAKVAKKIMPEAVILSIDVIGDYEKQVEEKGFKLINQILNMGTLLMSLNTKVNKDISDLYVKITQPEVSQMSFNKKAIEEAIKNGETYMKRNIKKFKELLNI